ncbi:hypothetical protein L6452_26889 [Arctium lappa]|uniref:Uncharacterized protein n=1 Tax=Arctium lappa TaxID=4217 RepID=A0ACB8ZUJ1_ARCLA|nr:hypothetical protein L6452_26889 [Arctium lappa]
MANEAKISIKVLVDKGKNRVVFAEADHNFVDVLFSFMTLPMGAIVRLLGEQDENKFEALGSLNNLYQSLVDLPVSHFFTEECKAMLLNPRSSSYGHCRKLKLNIDDTEPTKYFICGEWSCNRSYMSCMLSPCNTTRCSRCGKLMNQEIRFKSASSSADDDCVSSGVFVSDITTFIVTDDLCVMPYTLESCIQLLKDVGISDIRHVEERMVDIGRKEVLDLLGLALSCSCPLTYLLLDGSHLFQALLHPVQGSFNLSTLIKNEVSTSPKFSLHVILQKSTGKLLFAEAEEDLVDFIFGFLGISLGAVIGTLMNGASSLVCMDNIFKSVLNLSKGRYLNSEKGIEGILSKPYFGYQYPSKYHVFPLEKIVPNIFVVLPQVDSSNWFDASYLTFERGKGTYTDFKDPSFNRELFKRSGMFKVTDDLVVTPNSFVSTMENLKKLKVPLIDIEKHNVIIGLEEGINLLKASLRSSSVLTSGLEDHLKKLNPNFC